MMMATDTKFEKFQLDVLDALTCMREKPILGAGDSLSFLSGYLRAAGWEIIAEAMQRTQATIRAAESAARDGHARAERS